MAKEVSTIFCADCESEYKLLFDLNKTSGHPKFCPFCSGEVYNKDDEDNESEDE